MGILLKRTWNSLTLHENKNIVSNTLFVWRKQKLPTQFLINRVEMKMSATSRTSRQRGTVVFYHTPDSYTTTIPRFFTDVCQIQNFHKTSIKETAEWDERQPDRRLSSQKKRQPASHAMHKQPPSMLFQASLHAISESPIRNRQIPTSAWSKRLGGLGGFKGP